MTIVVVDYLWWYSSERYCLLFFATKWWF